jgi:hypothetical protein
VERDGKSLLEWIRIHSLRGLPGLAGPELGFLRTSTASVLRNDACLRLPARDTRTPNNPTKAISQSEFIKSRVARHQNSFPTSIYNEIDQIAKKAKQIMHKMALLQAEVAELRKANTLISKRRKAKKTRIRLKGSLNLQNVQDLQDQKDITQQIQQKMRENGAGSNRGQLQQRHYGNCGKLGHNARTCSIDIESSGEAYSD